MRNVTRVLSKAALGIFVAMMALAVPAAQPPASGQTTGLDWCRVYSHDEEASSTYAVSSGGSLQRADPNEMYDITIMFFYTRQFADDFRDRAHMEDEIGRSVGFLNVALANSDVNATFRIVGIERHTAMPVRQGPAMEWIQSDERAKRRRDELGADLVYALVDDRSGILGIAYQPAYFEASSTGSWGFVGSINNFCGVSGFPDCDDVWRTVLRHEVGHNLGISHSPEFGGDPQERIEVYTSDGQRRVLTGAVGFTNLPESWGTVMGWNNRLVFSSSSYRYEGRVVGERGVHEAASVLRFTVDVVSNYRPPAPPGISVTAAEALESDGAVDFDVRLSSASDSVVTVDYATGDAGGAGLAIADLDYTATQGTLTFPAGTTERRIRVAVTDDEQDEGDEEIFLLTLRNPSNAVLARGAVIGTIRDDDDPPSVSVAAAEALESEGAVEFDVYLSEASGFVVTVAYETIEPGGASGARAGLDYTTTRGTLTFPAGTTAGPIRVPVADDGQAEGPEEFVLRLYNPSNATFAGGDQWLFVTGTIRDDDSVVGGDDEPEVEVSFGSPSYEVREGGSVQVELHLSADPEREVTIPLVARHLGGATDADYSGLPESVTFSSGETRRMFEFRATDDSDEDYGESVDVAFGDLPTGVTGAGSTTIAILDDDTPPTSVIEVSGVDCDSELCRAVTGEAVSFTDASTGPAELRLWDFGDGATSDLKVVDHSWSQPGFYTVSLWVSDGSRESATSLKFLVEASDPAGSCVADSETMCLQDSRFSVTMGWWTGDGQSGSARVVHEGTNDSGLFRFFDRDNWEVLIKVLNGCALNDHVWVYGASATTLGYSIRVTDTVTGAVSEYRNAPGERAAAITDNEAFPESCSGMRASSSPGVRLAMVPEASHGGGCAETPTTMCLQEGRYAVSVGWSKRNGETGVGRVLRPRTDDSGLFYFFSAENWEMLVKVLDGCANNGRHWVFAASATDVGLDLMVRDTRTGMVRNYTKKPGEPARAVADVGAFPEGCQAR